MTNKPQKSPSNVSMTKPAKKSPQKSGRKRTLEKIDLPTKKIDIVDYKALKKEFSSEQFRVKTSIVEAYEKQRELESIALKQRLEAVRQSILPKYTKEDFDELAETALALLENDLTITLEKVCEELGLTLQTFYTYIRYRPEIDAAYERNFNHSVNLIRDNVKGSALNDSPLKAFNSHAIILNKYDERGVQGRTGGNVNILINTGCSSLPPEMNVREVQNAEEVKS